MINKITLRPQYPVTAISDIRQATVSVFADRFSLGTRARVWLAQGAPQAHELDLLLSHSAGDANCWSWLEEDVLQVRSVQRGVAIHFCGHGLLASAWVWGRQGWPPGEVKTAATSYRVSTGAGGQTWLHCPRITSTPTTRPPPLHWFNVPPMASAQAGGGHGYWILRWPDGFDLRFLRPDLRAISLTRRAVIATARARQNQVTLRYFAPQYGNPEDSVTGSACVVLADYWQQPQLTLRQCSPRGGLVEAQLESHSIAISGAVSLEAAG